MPFGSKITDAIKQLFEVSPTGKDFFALVNVLFERAEIVGRAPLDILLGAETNPEEKATKTNLRAQGSTNQMAGLSIMQDVEILKKLAWVIWTMTLERLPYDQKYKIGKKEVVVQDLNVEVEFDVPHLSGLAERQVRIEKLDKLLVILSKMPFFGHPAMVPVLYEILKRKAKSEMIEDFEEIFPVSLVTDLTMPMSQEGGIPGVGNPLDMLKTMASQGAMQ